MRNTTNDKTLYLNYIKKFRFLIKEYEIVKQKKHNQFRFVSDFYKFHNTNRQTFLKYYNRFYLSGNENDLVPQKRGPKWKSRRPLPYIENKVKELRTIPQGKTWDFLDRHALYDLTTIGAEVKQGDGQNVVGDAVGDGTEIAVVSVSAGKKYLIFDIQTNAK